MTPDPSPVAPDVLPPARSLFHYAATASVWLSIVPWIVGFLISVLAGDIYRRMDRDLADVLIRLVSAVIIFGSALGALILGFIALCGIAKRGPKGILGKALAGISIALCWLFLSIFAVET